jgi:hypothetical protein
MKEVVFDNGKLVLQKRKISQMDELFLIASKEHDKKKELEKQKESGLDIYSPNLLGGAFSTRKDFLFVEDSVFETMNTYFSEEILNIETEYKEENYNQLFLTRVSRKISNIEIKEQYDQFFRRVNL